MIRDISSITRDLEKKHNNDIIFKKYMIEKMFKEDPDILELLGINIGGLFHAHHIDGSHISLCIHMGLGRHSLAVP